jgi:hypothetical protein
VVSEFEGEMLSNMVGSLKGSTEGEELGASVKDTLGRLNGDSVGVLLEMSDGNSV